MGSQVGDQLIVFILAEQIFSSANEQRRFNDSLHDELYPNGLYRVKGTDILVFTNNSYTSITYRKIAFDHHFAEPIRTPIDPLLSGPLKGVKKRRTLARPRPFLLSISFRVHRWHVTYEPLNSSRKRVTSNLRETFAHSLPSLNHISSGTTQFLRCRGFHETAKDNTGLPCLRFDIAEAARILKFSRATLYSRISSGAIRTQKDGRRTYITRDELERYVASRD